MFATEIAIIFLLLLVNAFFAMSEMAIVSASRPILRQWAKQGNRRAERALALAEDAGNFLSTVQVGITLVGILAGTYGGASITEKIAPLLDTIPWINPYGTLLGGIVVVTLITYFSVIIGELIPKQFALGHAEAIACFVAGPMTVLSLVASPFVYVFKRSAQLIMIVLGINRPAGDEVTEAEVHAVLAEGAESGAIEKTEHDMLRRIISLADRSVKSIMTHRTEIAAIDIKDPPDEIIRIIREAGHSRYPVTDGDPASVIGCIQAKDILTADLSKKSFSIKEFVRDIPTLPETANCLKALDYFRTSNIHMAIIVDEYGSTEGIITSADLLEAIVGILPSNYDEEEHILIRERDDGSYLIDGRTPIHEIQLTFGFNDLDTEADYETIAGFVVQQLRKNPEEGDHFEAFGHRFEVIDMDGRRIDKILMMRAQIRDDEDDG